MKCLSNWKLPLRRMVENVVVVVLLVVFLNWGLGAYRIRTQHQQHGDTAAVAAVVAQQFLRGGVVAVEVEGVMVVKGERTEDDGSSAYQSEYSMRVWQYLSCPIPLALALVQLF